MIMLDHMTAEQAAEAAKGLTFEKVWAALMENREQIKDMSKNISGLSDSFGRFTEAMFSGKLDKKFSEIGFAFSSQARDKEYTENKRIIAEIDLVLENGE